MEKRKIIEIESYMTMEYYPEDEDSDETETPYSVVFDLSNQIPGELELEEEIRTGYLRNKYRKK